MVSSKWIVSALASTVLFNLPASARAPERPPDRPPSIDERVDHLTREVEELKALVRQLQSQLAGQSNATAAAPGSPVTSVPPVAGSTPTVAPNVVAGSGSTAGAAMTAGSAAESAPVVGAPTSGGPVADLLHGVTIDAMLDGYYEYNTNDPIGRVNYLRAYDVSSNSFSLNQADLILESAADPASGKREGFRIDLQYGQSTSTLQGNPANELRPDVYRNIFQAYGTYVFPLGAGLTVDFGKWASSLGLEGNYTKDQLNYSRSFWFDYPSITWACARSTPSTTSWP
jgi:hypothetical protein